MIKNKCVRCNNQFDNSEEHYNQHGNYCQKCIHLFCLKEIWRRAKNSKDHVAVVGNTKTKYTLKDMTDIIFKKYGVNMIEDNELYETYKNNLYGILYNENTRNQFVKI